jgi:alpha-1,3-rhamnosyltransferase
MGSELNQPLVSMVIPSFNHGQYVQACIKSILAQDYKNIELIIIDDGSTDDSIYKIDNTVRACTNRFVNFEFRSRPNKGLAATINEALEWARGTYFAAIASDDLLHTNKTSSLLAHIEREEDVAGVFGGCEFIDQAGLVFGGLSPLPAYYKFDDIIARGHVIVTPSQLLRLKLVREVGCYPAGLYIEDWYMWLALTQGGYKLKVVPDQLVQYRQHESNISKNALKMLQSRKWILGCFKDHPLYEHAMAQIHVAAAIDFSCNSKKRSAGYLIKAAAYSWKIVFKQAFLSSLTRLFMPCFLVKAMSRVKLWLRSNIIGVRHSW